MENQGLDTSRARAAHQMQYQREVIKKVGYLEEVVLELKSLPEKVDQFDAIAKELDNKMKQFDIILEQVKKFDGLTKDIAKLNSLFGKIEKLENKVNSYSALFDNQKMLESKMSKIEIKMVSPERIDQLKEDIAQLKQLFDN